MCPIFLAALTQSIGEPLRLVIVNYGYTQRVEANEAKHSPVEALRFDQAADGEAYPLFFPSEVRRAVVLALHTAPGKRRPLGSCWDEALKKVNLKTKNIHLKRSTM